MECQKTKKRGSIKLFLAVGAVLILCGIVFAALPMMKHDKKQPEVITVSTLQKIVNVSELSTFTAVYNGVAQVMNVEEPEKIDYYVSYEAKVNAGLDLEKIGIAVDHENKEIRITLPEIYITDVNVDIASMDFIFYNKKANVSTVSQTAFKACEADVQKESQQQKQIFNLAKQNAENILTALINPIVEQLDSEYNLLIA